MRRLKKTGFTLIEFLIACAIGFILLEGLIDIQTSVSKADQKIQNLNDSTEKEQLAYFLLTKAIHSAGDETCESGKTINQTLAITAENDHSFIIGECIPYQKKLQFIQTTYFIDNTNRKDDRGRKIYALYQKKLGGQREELIPNIFEMEVWYGVKQNNRLNYFAASKIQNWLLVHSVKLKLILENNNQTQTFFIEANLRNRQK